MNMNLMTQELLIQHAIAFHYEKGNPEIREAEYIRCSPRFERLIIQISVFLNFIVNAEIKVMLQLFHTGGRLNEIKK